jgi:regulator of sirC expression with transglutaminase-like and TPR domain
MPILMLILADRLGLDVSLSTAPMHLLMKFTESETGRTYNVEATSGGGFSRDAWYQQSMGISDEAMRSGIYLQKLTRRETVLAILDLLGDFYLQSRLLDKALDHFTVSLKQYPKNVYAMLKIGACYARLFQEQFATKYRKEGDVPVSERALLNFYVEQNKRYFQMAESLGWHEENVQQSRTNNLTTQQGNKHGA